MIKPLLVFEAPPGDARGKAAYELASKWLDIYIESGIENRDTLISAAGILLAQMFAGADAPEEFARFVVSQQLTEIVVRNIGPLRRAIERKANEKAAN